jgi:hypothetical protein
LREAIYRVFATQAHGRAPAQADLDILNRELSSALAKSQIVATAHGFGWEWMSDETVLDRMLWPVVRSAADLLTSADLLQRVGNVPTTAAAAGCSWIRAKTAVVAGATSTTAATEPNSGDTTSGYDSARCEGAQYQCDGSSRNSFHG